MKREGRQHGMVRTYRILPDPLNPRPGSRFVNRLDSPPTAGLFTKLPSKPTNHSKFTGKCGQPRCRDCHMNPTSKAKDKTKGVMKLRSNNVATNYKLLTWRVMDGRPGLDFSGFSATGILDHLSSHVDDDDYDYDHDGVEVDEGTISQNLVGKETHDNGERVNENYDDDDAMSFCDVGIIVDHVEGDEDWCLVEEM